MDPLALRRTYGRQLRMLGGIDKMAVARRPRQQLRPNSGARCRPCLPEGGSCRASITRWAPISHYRNFVYYFRRLKELCGVPENPAAPYLKIRIAMEKVYAD